MNKVIQQNETPYFLDHGARLEWCRDRLNNVILSLSHTTGAHELEFRPKKQHIIEPVELPNEIKDTETETEPAALSEVVELPNEIKDTETETEPAALSEVVELTDAADLSNEIKQVEELREKINKLEIVDNIVKETEKERELTLQALRKMENLLNEVKKPGHFSRRKDTTEALTKYKNEVIKRKKSLLKAAEKDIDETETQAKLIKKRVVSKKKA